MPKRLRRTKADDGWLGRWGVGLGILGIGFGGLTFVMSRLAMPWWGLGLIASASVVTALGGAAMLVHRVRPRWPVLGAYIVIAAAGIALSWGAFWSGAMAVSLFEGYPEQWANLERGKRERIQPGTTLKNPLRREEHRLSLRVHHEILETTLRNVHVFLWTPRAIRVRTTPEGGPKPNEDYWIHVDVTDTENQYRLSLDNIPHGVYVGPDADLFLTIPSPGIYRLRYVIAGSTHAAGFNPIRGEFKVEIVK